LTPLLSVKRYPGLVGDEGDVRAARA